MVRIDCNALTALMGALSGTYSLPMGESGANVVTTSLPGDCVCAAARMSDGLWVLLDFDKPMAHRHARAMLREWRELYLAEGLCDDDGERLPEPCREPVALTLVS